MLREAPSKPAPLRSPPSGTMPSAPGFSLPHSAARLLRARPSALFANRRAKVGFGLGFFFLTAWYILAKTTVGRRATSSRQLPPWRSPPQLQPGSRTPAPRRGHRRHPQNPAPAAPPRLASPHLRVRARPTAAPPRPEPGEAARLPPEAPPVITGRRRKLRDGAAAPSAGAGSPGARAQP